MIRTYSHIFRCMYYLWLISLRLIDQIFIITKIILLSLGIKLVPLCKKFQIWWHWRNLFFYKGIILQRFLDCEIELDGTAILIFILKYFAWSMVSSINYHSVNMAKHTLLETWLRKKHRKRDILFLWKREYLLRKDEYWQNHLRKAFW